MVIEKKRPQSVEDCSMARGPAVRTPGGYLLTPKEFIKDVHSIAWYWAPYEGPETFVPDSLAFNDTAKVPHNKATLAIVECARACYWIYGDIELSMRSFNACAVEKRDWMDDIDRQARPNNAIEIINKHDDDKLLRILRTLRFAE